MYMIIRIIYLELALLKFQGGGGVSKTQKFKAMYEVKLEFLEGWGGHRANPFRGGVWIFSGATHCVKMAKSAH